MCQPVFLLEHFKVGYDIADEKRQIFGQQLNPIELFWCEKFYQTNLTTHICTRPLKLQHCKVSTKVYFISCDPSFGDGNLWKEKSGSICLLSELDTPTISRGKTYEMLLLTQADRTSRFLLKFLFCKLAHFARNIVKFWDTRIPGSR